MANDFPYFPWYPKDWQSDGKVRQLSYEERGVYFELLCHMWTYDGSCSLPDGAGLIRRMLGISAAKWRSIRQVLVEGVGAVLQVNKDGRLVSERLRREWDRATEKSAKAKASAEVGHALRKGSVPKTAANQQLDPTDAQRTQSEGNATAQRTQSEGNATQDPDPESDKTMVVEVGTGRPPTSEDDPWIRPIGDKFSQLTGQLLSSNDQVLLPKAIATCRSAGLTLDAMLATMDRAKESFVPTEMDPGIRSLKYFRGFWSKGVTAARPQSDAGDRLAGKAARDSPEETGEADPYAHLYRRGGGVSHDPRGHS